MRHAVGSLDWMQVRDALSPTGTVTQFPSLDLAVVAFAQAGEPVWANVLFSREFPDGIVAQTGQHAGNVGNVRFECDQVGAAGTNVPGVPARDDTSSGMPVPGTNTPEHIVENGNSDHNSMNNM